MDFNPERLCLFRTASPPVNRFPVFLSSASGANLSDALDFGVLSGKLDVQLVIDNPGGGVFVSGDLDWLDKKTGQFKFPLIAW